MIRSTRLTRLIGLIVAAIGMTGCTVRHAIDANPAVRQAIRVELPSGNTTVDLYWPRTQELSPLVIVAHGFWRDRGRMAGWGEHLSGAGFVVAIPDLPAWSDHSRNGQFLAELKVHLADGAEWPRIDARRTGLMGFSAGGLATLIASATEPAPTIWVGLDPVDRGGLGSDAASRLKCRAVVLTADPSGCNANGNVRGILAALASVEHQPIAGAVHVDAEWPTDALAEMACGRSTPEKRAEFQQRATAALIQSLMPGKATQSP